MSLVKDARARSLGPLSPGFNLNEILLRDMRCGLPTDAHIRATGKLFISLTRVSDGKNVIVSDYKSREELIQVLLCSCFVPLYSGFFPPKYRGVRYVDGGLSNNLPAFHDTITVSPWSGNSDICPRNDGSVSLVDLSFVNTSIQLTASNLYRVSTMFFPPDPEVLKNFCCQGFRETVQYLRDHGLFETVHPLRNNMSFSSLLHKQEERRTITRRMSHTARCMYKLNCEESTSLHSVGSQSPIASNESLLKEQPSRFDLVECIDENDNQCETVNPKHTESRLQKVFTVVHVYPVLKDHTIKVQFELPQPVLAALEAALDCQPSSSWKKPLSSILSVCRQTFVIRLPLEKTYMTACYLLHHSAALPKNVSSALSQLQELVCKLQQHFKCSGEILVEKLRQASEATVKDIELLVQRLTFVVQLIMQKVIVDNVAICTSWLTPLTNSKAFLRSLVTQKNSFNPRISPFLQMV